MLNSMLIFYKEGFFHEKNRKNNERLELHR